MHSQWYSMHGSPTQSGTESRQRSSKVFYVPRIRGPKVWHDPGLPWLSWAHRCLICVHYPATYISASHFPSLHPWAIFPVPQALEENHGLMNHLDFLTFRHPWSQVLFTLLALLDRGLQTLNAMHLSQHKREGCLQFTDISDLEQTFQGWRQDF